MKQDAILVNKSLEAILAEISRSADSKDQESQFIKRRSGQVTQSRETVYKKTPSSNLMVLSVVECEAVGAPSPLPCLVIRGISDHADSHKNDDRHGYASAVAAAYIRHCSSIC
jgi:hypothetical protein